MRVGAVDIGTNSMRLLLAERGPSGAVELVRVAEVTGLGVGVDRTGLLDAASIGRTVPVLERYGEMIGRVGVDRLRAVATSALRDAGNGAAFLEAATVALGVGPEIISGSEEAELSFAGATGGSARGRTVVVDVGGGSTEFVSGRREVAAAVSVDMGSVRLTDRCLQQRPVPAAALRLGVDAADASVSGVAMDGADAAVIGVAGTFTSLAAIHLGLSEYDRERVHGAVLTADDVAALVGDLAARSLPEIEAIPSLDPARAPVILGGAIVVWRALVHLGATEVTVSEHDLLDGLVAGLLAD